MSTSRHVEVFREAAAPGERRRYSKRFLATVDGDFRHWTAREGRVLAYLSANGVRGVPAIAATVAGPDEALQTFDAGITVEQWTSLVPVERAGGAIAHPFTDAAHWWALALHALRALESLYLAHVVHLRVMPANICVPALPPNLGADMANATIGLKFARLAMIDFAFALTPQEPLVHPFPASASAAQAWQSPRLVQALADARAGDLRAMHALDWRCDLFGMAALLRRYLPKGTAPAKTGWTDARYSRAVVLLTAMLDAHDSGVGDVRPHADLIERCEGEMQEPDVVTSLLEGFVLAPASRPAPVPLPPGRMTPRVVERTPINPPEVRPPPAQRELKPLPLGVASAIGLALVLAGIGPFLRDQWQANRAHQQSGDVTVSSAPRVPPPTNEAAVQERRSSELAADVETMQRAARNEPRDAAPAPSTAMPQPPSRQPVEPTPAPPPRAAAPPPVVAPAPKPAPPVIAPAPAPTPPVATPAPSRAVDAPVAPVPRGLVDVAGRMQGDVARVLAIAARAAKPSDDDNVLQAARSMRSITGSSGLPTESRTLARTLNAEARAAWERQDIDRAIGLQQRSFRANPNDPEVVGNLAFLYLKARPPRPAQARQVALYALAARGSSFPAGREADWGTFAVASALEGREADAAQALFVMFALSKNPERACRAALLAMAQYGPAMAGPARSMLSRVRGRGSAATAPSCR